MKRVTIIGAGLGGLSAGALLAKRGYRVTILEQHNIVGGCATTFKRKGGFSCEVGLHEMEGVYTNPKIVEIFKELNVYENVEFIKANEFFEVTTKRGKFLMPDGLDSAKRALIDRFPSEQEAIEYYFKLISKISKDINTLQNPSWYQYPTLPIALTKILLLKSKSVTDIFNKIFKNQELKLILNANVQYYNDSPDTLSFLLHAIAQHSYYKGGGYFIKGGSQVLSDYFAKVIKDNSGEIITKALVTKCSSNSVEYKYKDSIYTIKSDKIISNLSPQDTYRLFNIDYTEKKPLGDALLTIYLGFSKNIKEHYGKRAYSNFILDDIESVEEFNAMIKKDILKRAFTFVDYSQIDSNLTKDNSKSFCVVTMVDKIEDWQKISQNEYQDKKAKLIEVVLKKLDKYYPNISSFVEYAEVGTAKTVKRYIKTPNGTAYGFKPTPKEFFRAFRFKSNRVKNLYFVGQWVIAGGFSPAIMSGAICANKI